MNIQFGDILPIVINFVREIDPNTVLHTAGNLLGKLQQALPTPIPTPTATPAPVSYPITPFDCGTGILETCPQTGPGCLGTLVNGASLVLASCVVGGLRRR